MPFSSEWCAGRLSRETTFLTVACSLTAIALVPHRSRHLAAAHLPSALRRLPPAALFFASVAAPRAHTCVRGWGGGRVAQLRESEAAERARVLEDAAALELVGREERALQGDFAFRGLFNPPRDGDCLVRCAAQVEEIRWTS